MRLSQSFFRALALSLALTGLVGCSRQPTAISNVILISIDTLRADHLSCYGYSRSTSPFLDSLAGSGVQFENAYVQVPGTLPSHMSIFTGLPPREHDVFPPDSVLSHEIRTLPEMLSERGVRTAGFTEGGYVAGRFGFSRGFHSFDDSAKKISTDIEDTFLKGINFIRSQDRGVPFFLFLHTYAVHDPYFPPPPYCQLYLSEVTEPEVAEFKGMSDVLLQGENPQTMELQRRLFLTSRSFVSRHLPPGIPMPTGPNLASFHGQYSTNEAVLAADYYRSLYDGTINYVDDVLKTFIRILGDLGVADSTVVIITSDHGEEFFEHGRFAHSQVYNECLHVPLIVNGPGIPGGRRVEEIVTSLDLAPTILDLFDIEIPTYLTGQSLLPVVGPQAVRPQPRDAHAVGVVDRAEALYRKVGESVFQLVINSWEIPDQGFWVTGEVSFQTILSRVNLSLKSFHEDRTVTVRVEGQQIARYRLRPEWTDIELELPDDGRKRTVTLVGMSCASPADLGVSSDTRCLSFQVQSLPPREIEFFDISSDPLSTIDLSDDSPGLLRSQLAALQSFEKGPTAEAQRVPLDPETEERLRALGYLE